MIFGSGFVDKPWGKYATLFQDAKIRLDLLLIDANKGSSRHYHDRHVNIFMLIHGSITVDTFLDNGAPTTSHLKNDGDGAPVYIPAGRIHRFYATKDSIVYEVSFCQDGVLNMDDIIRLPETDVEPNNTRLEVTGNPVGASPKI